MKIDKCSGSFFESLYKKNSDPWNFEHDPYEIARYDSIIKAIGHKRYSKAFEPGCSIGILTERLATLCDEVIAIDISPTALHMAQKRCTHLKNVFLTCHSINEWSIDKATDLIVLCEIGYYFEVQQWKKIVSDLIKLCGISSTLIAAHWLGKSSDHMLSGNEVHQAIMHIDGLELQYSEKHELFRLDRWIIK